MGRLREAGHDVTAIVRDSSGASDEEILERAAREGRVVLTFDRDYGRLLYEESPEEPLVPAGIVYFPFDPSPSEEPTDYLLALLEQPGFSVIGKLTVVERDRYVRDPCRKLVEKCRYTLIRPSRILACHAPRRPSGFRSRLFR